MHFAHNIQCRITSYNVCYTKLLRTAVINNFGGFYRTWVYFNEARRQGATIELPCINNSNYKTSIKGTHIYIGFIHIANLEQKFALTIIDERNKNGDFKDLEDFIDRVSATADRNNFV